MALKSNREGLRKESVDYLGNLIIDEKLKEKIYNSIDSFIKLDLLWTNASPTSAFAAQAININLENYHVVIIEVIEDGNTAPDTSLFFFILKTANKIVLTDTTDNARWRVINSISDNSISFNVAITSTASSGVVTNNNILIPYKIYGVK